MRVYERRTSEDHNNNFRLGMLFVRLLQSPSRRCANDALSVWSHRLKIAAEKLFDSTQFQLYKYEQKSISADYQYRKI